MASVHATVGRISEASRAATGATQSILEAVPLASEMLAAGASPVLGSTVVPSTSGTFWFVQAIDADVYVAFGSDPDASANPRWLIRAGDNWAVVAVPGHKMSVVVRS